MPHVGISPWGALENRSAPVFLVAGVLLLIATLNEAMLWLTEVQLPGLLEFAGFLGAILSYIGLLSLYPRITGRESQLAMVGLGLLLLPVVAIVIDVVFVALGGEPPLGGTIILGAFGLFALGVALFGGLWLRTTELANTVGGLLLVYVLGWAVMIGGTLYWSSLPDGVPVLASALMAISLVAIGYILRTEPEPPDRAEPVPDTTAK